MEDVSSEEKEREREELKSFKQYLNETIWRTPFGDDIISYFETSQGSKYLLSKDGHSKRIKSVHANTGGQDAGVKPWYDHCIFVDKKYEYQANSPQFLANYMDLKSIFVSIKDNRLAFYKRDGSDWKPLTMSDAYQKAKLKPDPIVLEFSTKPVNGYSCVEFKLNNDKSISSWHFGSEVSKILDIKDVDDETIKQFSSK